MPYCIIGVDSRIQCVAGDDKKGPSPATATGIGEHHETETEKSMGEQKFLSPKDEGVATPPKMIFCYGDSLTYGMTPGTRERKLTFVVTCLIALLVLILGYR